MVTTQFLQLFLDVELDAELSKLLVHHPCILPPHICQPVLSYDEERLQNFFQQTVLVIVQVLPNQIQVEPLAEEALHHCELVLPSRVHCDLQDADQDGERSMLEIPAHLALGQLEYLRHHVFVLLLEQHFRQSLLHADVDQQPQDVGFDGMELGLVPLEDVFKRLEQVVLEPVPVQVVYGHLILVLHGDVHPVHAFHQLHQPEYYPLLFPLLLLVGEQLLRRSVAALHALHVRTVVVGYLLSPLHVVLQFPLEDGDERSEVELDDHGGVRADVHHEDKLDDFDAVALHFAVALEQSEVGDEGVEDVFGHLEGEVLVAHEEVFDEGVLAEEDEDGLEEGLVELFRQDVVSGVVSEGEELLGILRRSTLVIISNKHCLFSSLHILRR